LNTLKFTSLQGIYVKFILARSFKLELCFSRNRFPIGFQARNSELLHPSTLQVDIAVKYSEFFKDI